MKFLLRFSLSLVALCSFGAAPAVTNPTTATHKWVPYRPIDPKQADAAQLVGVQIIDNGGFILTFNKPLDPICTAGTAAVPALGPTRLYFMPDDSLETSASSVKAALATALAALQGGGQVHVLYNFTSSLCLGRFIAITK